MEHYKIVIQTERHKISGLVTASQASQIHQYLKADTVRIQFVDGAIYSIPTQRIQWVSTRAAESDAE